MAPPEAAQGIQAACPQIQAAFNSAFSIATGATFVVGIVTALLAAVVVLIVMPAGRIGQREG
jgi:hypothetical protein